MPRPAARHVAHHVAVPRCADRAGFTLLEAVLAVTLLAMIAAVLLSGMSNLWRQQARQQQALGAAELANRLMLQFLDDRRSLPSIAEPLRYGPYEYAWAIDERPIRVEENANIQLKREARAAAGTRIAGAGLDRLGEIRVVVWMYNDTATTGPDNLGPGAPSATLTRLHDPMNLARNPDSLEHAIKSGGFGAAFGLGDDVKRTTNKGDGAAPAPNRQ